MITTNELKITLQGDTDVLWERSFNAPAAMVFDVLTKPEHIQRWQANFGYKVESTADLRNGGAYRNYFTNDAGQNFALLGEYRELSPPSRMVFTETMEGVDGPPAVNTVTLEERDGRTFMTMVQSFSTKEQREAVLATGMAEGAGVSFNQMDEYLKTLV
jgi:uncharacterized protein YndB with AHSA1/START domain